MAMRGISVKANSLRAAVCPAMTFVPRPLMPYCSTTEPAETMLLIKPMERLWLNRSQYSFLWMWKCFFSGRRILVLAKM